MGFQCGDSFTEVVPTFPLFSYRQRVTPYFSSFFEEVRAVEFVASKQPVSGPHRGMMSLRS